MERASSTPFHKECLAAASGHGTPAPHTKKTRRRATWPWHGAAAWRLMHSGQRFEHLAKDSVWFRFGQIGKTFLAFLGISWNSLAFVC